jgi:hypothetical protein
MDFIGSGACRIAGLCSDSDIISGFITEILLTVDLLSANEII